MVDVTILSFWYGVVDVAVVFVVLRGLAFPVLVIAASFFDQIYFQYHPIHVSYCWTT